MKEQMHESEMHAKLEELKKDKTGQTKVRNCSFIF